MPRGLSSLRALNVGPIVGEYGRAANYHNGQQLGPRDVSLSPNQMRKYPINSYINAQTTSGKGLGTYRVADPSYTSRGPTTNTIEFRNRLLSGQGVNISSASNPYGFVQGGIDIFGDYPNPPSSGFQDTGPYLPGQFQQAYRGGTYNAFTDPTQDTSATPPPSMPAPTLTPFDPMGYGSGNPPPNDNVSPDLINTFYGSDVTNDTRGSGGGGYPDLSGAPPVTPQGYYDNPGYINPQYIGAEIPGNVNIPGQNYAGYQPPVARATAVQPPGGFFGRILRRLTGQPMGNFTYPVPGLGMTTPPGATSDWRSNATWGGGPSGLGLGAGFWSNLRQAGGSFGALGAGFSGGQAVSNIPEYSGFAGPVGRSSAGPLQP